MICEQVREKFVVTESKDFQKLEKESGRYFMTIEEIMSGESEYLEFKQMIPEKSETYMKTVVARRGFIA